MSESKEAQNIRESSIRMVLMESTKVFPNDVICINIAMDLVTTRCHVAGSTCPEEVAKYVSEMAHKCIDDWYRQNSQDKKSDISIDKNL